MTQTQKLSNKRLIHWNAHSFLQDQIFLLVSKDNKNFREAAANCTRQMCFYQYIKSSNKDTKRKASYSGGKEYECFVHKTVQR